MLFFSFFFFCKKIGQDTEHASQIHLAGILVLPRGGLSVRRTVLFSYQFYRVLTKTVPFVSFLQFCITDMLYFTSELLIYLIAFYKSFFIYIVFF